MSEFEEKEYQSNSLDRGLWAKIFRLLGEHKKHLLLLLLFNVIAGLFESTIPLLMRHAINNFTVSYIPSDLTNFAFLVLFVIIVQAVNVFIFLWQAAKVEMNFNYSVRKKTFNHLQNLSFSYYDKTSLGWIVARLTSDIGRLSEIISWGLMDMIWGLSQMIFTAIIMLWVDWRLALIVLFVVPLIAVISSWFQVRILKNYRDVRKTNSQITAAFSEGISGAKTIKTMVLEDNQNREFNDLTTTMRTKSIRAALLSSIFMPIVFCLSHFASAGLIWYGGEKVLSGVLAFGTLMMFVQYSGNFFEPLRQIARLMAEMQLAQASGERIMTLLEEEPAIVDSPEVIAKYGTIFEPKPQNYEVIDGNVEFKDITFYYKKEEPILEHFNLKVKSGQTIALVGETGSGKSTIVNLLCRFYEPISGEILIDGVDYRQRSLGWLHSQLGYVLQAPHLFSGSIRDNIRYGKLDASEEEIIHAAKLVNAHDFVESLEKGYDTDVGEGGNRLSTGQKQLISFARALIRKPTIFVLDEATSSIDTETEKIIQEAIERVLKGHTSFIIAHRLSTIVNADRILVIRKGQIVEDGTHKELMKKRDYYFRLYTNQYNQEMQQRILNERGGFKDETQN
ncbi:MAG: ABC transporter ATP-binding protein/permease [Erysipelotrichaceae bacterium]|jgi:ATP-binding cassette subfamily B protein|nr:ABC transporter ATP-binding protein/permease [Erysipelotrichaceae bacterium]